MLFPAGGVCGWVVWVIGLAGEVLGMGRGMLGMRGRRSWLVGGVLGIWGGRTLGEMPRVESEARRSSYQPVRMLLTHGHFRAGHGLAGD